MLAKTRTAVGVLVLPNFELLVHFADGKIKKYNVKNLAKKIKAFKQLERNKKLFSKVQVGFGGDALVWNEDIDLDSREIYKNGLDVTKSIL